MTAEKPDAKTHEKARDLVEKALEKYSDDKPKEAETLIDKAQSIDPTAAREVVADLDEDAGSNHTPTAG